MTFIYFACAGRNRAAVPKYSVYRETRKSACEAVLSFLGIGGAMGWPLFSHGRMALNAEVYGVDYAMVELSEMPSEFAGKEFVIEKNR